MEVKIVENTKDISCDVLIVNKFEGELTSNALINKFAPDSFTGKTGEVFAIHTRGELPSTYVMAVGFGDEQKLDNNIIRDSVIKAIKNVLS